MYPRPRRLLLWTISATVLLLLLAAVLPSGSASASPRAGPSGKPATFGPSGPLPPHAPPVTHFAVVFDETGLPSGVWWTIVLDGTSLSTEGRGSEIMFSEPDGTYRFSASAPGYVASPSAGTVTVAGTPVFTSISFYAPGSLFRVVFHETGLPPGTAWSVSLNGTPASSSSASIGFNKTNGSYAYAIGVAADFRLLSSSPGSPIAVRGANVSVALVFEAAYTVSFEETGMPPIAGGGVVFNASGTTSFGVAGMIAFGGLGNGSYAYQVTAAPGYRLISSTPGSPIAVGGSSVLVRVLFEAVFPVSFTEFGLPAGTTWSVTMSGGVQNSTGSQLVFSEVPNGTHSFTTATSSVSWQTTQELGNVTVVGSGVEVPIHFAFAYPATFDATGLPEGVEWYINLTGNLPGAASARAPGASESLVAYSFSSRLPELIFSLPNGSYTYQVSSTSSAWTPPSTNHSLTVAGASPPPQSIVPLQSQTGPSPLASQLLIWIVLGCVVAAVVSLAAVGYRTYALREAPREGPDALDELYASYDLPADLDPAASDQEPDELDDVF